MHKQVEGSALGWKLRVRGGLAPLVSLCLLAGHVERCLLFQY